MRTILILKGNVGSGKSTLAHALRGFTHLDIDHYYLRVGRTKKSATWHRDLAAIRKAYKLLYSDILRKVKTQHLVLESAGVNENWRWILPKLKKMKSVQLIQVYIKTPLWLCRQRVKKRNTTNEKHTALAFVDFISRLWHKNKPEYDYVINGKLSAKKALSELYRILRTQPKSYK